MMKFVREGDKRREAREVLQGEFPVVFLDNQKDAYIFEDIASLWPLFYKNLPQGIKERKAKRLGADNILPTRRVSSKEEAFQFLDKFDEFWDELELDHEDVREMNTGLRYLHRLDSVLDVLSLQNNGGRQLDVWQDSNNLSNLEAACICKNGPKEPLDLIRSPGSSVVLFYDMGKLEPLTGQEIALQVQHGVTDFRNNYGYKPKEGLRMKDVVIGAFIFSENPRELKEEHDARIIWSNIMKRVRSKAAV